MFFFLSWTQTFLHYIQESKVYDSLEICPLTPLINTSKTMWNDEGYARQPFLFSFSPTSLAVFESLAFSDTRDMVQKPKLSRNRKYAFLLYFTNCPFKHVAVAWFISQTFVNKPDQGIKRPKYLLLAVRNTRTSTNRDITGKKMFSFRNPIYDYRLWVSWAEGRWGLGGSVVESRLGLK